MTVSQSATIVLVLACVLVPYALEAFFNAPSTAGSSQ